MMNGFRLTKRPDMFLRELINMQGWIKSISHFYSHQPYQPRRLFGKVDMMHGGLLDD